VPEASGPREQVENRGRACTQVLFLLHKAELGLFHFLEIVAGSLVRRSQYNLIGTFHRRISSLAKTGFFKQVRELKIQRKNPGQCFTLRLGLRV
jgi:hypothetical protein